VNGLVEYDEFMALPKDYTGQACSLARSLEIVGERWTLLIVRDAFYGVRRFNDFYAHLQIPRAVLTARLALLVEEGVLDQNWVRTNRSEYLLTDKGLALWPIVLSLIDWGDRYYTNNGPRRIFRHDTDQAPLDATGECTKCGQQVAPRDIDITPGPSLEKSDEDSDVVTRTLSRPHRLLTPI
jgi:DNA-binding HxlR family transcriptional regulator